MLAKTRHINLYLLGAGTEKQRRVSIEGSLLLGLVEHIRQAALAAVLPVVVSSHEDSSSALLSRALTSQTVDLAVIINLVVLEDSKLDLLVLVLDLLGGGVVLLLPLLATTPESEHKVEGGLLLDVV